MKKRILSIILVLVMCLGLLPAAALAADPVSGTCGGNTRWALQNNVLTISGTGRMSDFDTPGSLPWYDQREDITSVIIGADVTSIGNQAFYGCSALTSVSIPNGVTSIGAQAFYQCSSLMGVTIPDSVNSIGNSAFGYCSSLMGITIPRSLYSMGIGVFQDCSRLVAIQAAPENPYYTSVDGVLFARDLNGELTTLLNYPGGKQGSYTIPDSVTSIEHYAFSGCKGLTSVTIPGSVTSIGDAAFGTCSALTEIIIPKSVEKIGTSTFAACTSLTAIQLENGNPNYTAVDGVLFNKDRTFLSAYPAGKQGAYTIPDSVISVFAYAFSGCTGLTGVTIPNSVLGMGNSAFWGCTGLTSVTIPDSMTTIGDYVFSHCSGLTRVTMPNSLEWIGDSAFWGCSGLTSFIIPDSVTWIGDYAFSHCTGLISITIPNGVTNIGAEAFWGCSRLNSVVIPASVTRIEPYTFSTCTGLTSVTIPGSVTSIGTSAFNTCSSLTSITIPDSVTSIGDHAFRNSGLTRAVIPGSVTSIGRSAFYDCTHLTAVAISDGVTSIGDYAFHTCSSMTAITIPSSVTSIGHAAFWDCSRLKDVYYTGTQYQWNSIRFSEYNQALTSATIHYNSTSPVNPTPSQQPASWAKADVDRAIAENILPPELRSAYSQPATRREFCVLADALYTRVTGSPALMEASVTFTDTTDPAVLRMASAGVVQGVGSGAFSPNGQLTREQAATMLARLATALGKPLTASAPTFADTSSVSTWARDAVGQMQKSGVMGGTGNNMFSPLVAYTREQSTVTIMRMFDLMK